jgi:hypothetical protein
MQEEINKIRSNSGAIGTKAHNKIIPCFLYLKHLVNCRHIQLATKVSPHLQNPQLDLNMFLFAAIKKREISHTCDLVSLVIFDRVHMHISLRILVVQLSGTTKLPAAKTRRTFSTSQILVQYRSRLFFCLILLRSSKSYRKVNCLLKSLM